MNEQFVGALCADVDVDVDVRSTGSFGRHDELPATLFRIV